MTDMELYRRPAELAIPAVNDTDSWTAVLTEVAQLASQIANTPFVPDGLRGSAPAVAAAILSGRELGLGPMTSLANIHVIKGKPALSAALMRALILAQGHQIETVDISDTRARVRGRRRGEAEWETAEFNADQAKRAGIVLGGYPQDKLYARATSRLARRKFADVIAGMPYSAEELDDGTDYSDVTLPGEMDGQPLSARAAIEQRPRTAQRKQRTPSSPPAQAAPPSAAAAPPNPLAAAGGDLPPLPGEEEITAPVPGGDAREAEASTAGLPGPGRPGDEKHRKLVGIVQGHFKRLGYHEEDDRDERLKDAARLAGVDPITSLNDLTHDDLSTVADAISRCRDRDRLKAVLVTLDDPRGEEATGE